MDLISDSITNIYDAISIFNNQILVYHSIYFGFFFFTNSLILLKPRVKYETMVRTKNKAISVQCNQHLWIKGILYHQVHIHHKLIIYIKTIDKNVATNAGFLKNVLVFVIFVLYKNNIIKNAKKLNKTIDVTAQKDHLLTKAKNAQTINHSHTAIIGDK